RRPFPITLGNSATGRVWGPKSASARPGPCTRPRSADALARREYHPARKRPASRHPTVVGVKGRPKLSTPPVEGPGGLASRQPIATPPGGGPVSRSRRFPGSDHHGQLRASDADRDQAVAQLGDHHVAGRLDLEEFTDRVSQALASKTLGELDLLFRDLP